MNISFVLLSWNAEEDLIPCLDSIVNKCASEKLDYRIFIVDNGSTDTTPELIKSYIAKDGKVSCMYLSQNTGTTYSRNLALKEIDSEYVFILDVDTEIMAGSINDMINYLSQNPKIGLLAPKLKLPNRVIQHSVKKFPTLNEKLAKIKKILNLGKYNMSDFYADFPFDQPRAVDTAISAAWFFSKKIIDEVGLLDENIFYSPEDVDYSLRIWKAGYKIVYYPYFEILHKTQQISHKKPFSKVAYSHLRGLLYYYNKHGYWFSRKKLYKKLNINLH